jgi:chromosome partitioning protein
MRTIVFATQKGGSRKSTLAACLAVAAQSAGERVFVFDLDPKKCLVKSYFHAKYVRYAA